MTVSTKAILAELALVVLLVLFGTFLIHPLIPLLLLASQSVWLRGSSWSDLGLRRPTSLPYTLLQATIAAAMILAAVRTAIVPSAVWLTGVPLDLSFFGEPGDARALAGWLIVAWTMAAFGEEMVFRGYLLRRIMDLVGSGTAGRLIAVIASSMIFGVAHQYQGWSGVITTGVIGGILGAVYVVSRCNLWIVIVCHGLVDTIGLMAIYFDRRSWIFG